MGRWVGGPSGTAQGCARTPSGGSAEVAGPFFCIRGDAPTWQLPEPGRAQTMAMDAGVDGPCPVVPVVRAAALQLWGRRHYLETTELE